MTPLVLLIRCADNSKHLNSKISLTKLLRIAALTVQSYAVMLRCMYHSMCGLIPGKFVWDCKVNLLNTYICLEQGFLGLDLLEILGKEDHLSLLIIVDHTHENAYRANFPTAIKVNILSLNIILIFKRHCCGRGKRTPVLYFREAVTASKTLEVL